MKGVTATWKEETEERIPEECFARLFVDAMGVVLGICKIYALMWGLLEEKKRNADNNLGNRSVSDNKEKQEAEHK